MLSDRNFKKGKASNISHFKIHMKMIKLTTLKVVILLNKYCTMLCETSLKFSRYCIGDTYVARVIGVSDIASSQT